MGRDLLDFLVHQFIFVPGHSALLSLVITLYLFCHSDGRLLHTRILSCEGYAFFQVHKNLKWIYLNL